MERAVDALVINEEPVRPLDDRWPKPDHPERVEHVVAQYKSWVEWGHSIGVAKIPALDYWMLELFKSIGLKEATTLTESFLRDLRDRTGHE